jgi:hypothetical protein
MGSREKLTVEIEPDLREAVVRWAREEDRPVGNLLRRIVAEAVRRKFPPATAAAPTAGPPARPPSATLDEAEAKLAVLAAERAGLMKRNGPPGPPDRHLSLEEEERLRWLHSEVNKLKGEVRQFERRVA